MTVEQLPDWWLQSDVYTTLRAYMAAIPAWNFVWAFALVLLTHVQFKGVPVDRRLRPGVLTVIMLVVLGLTLLLGVAALDGGHMLYHGSAFWAVVVLGYTWFMFVWRVHLRRVAARNSLPESAARTDNHAHRRTHES